MTQKRNHNLFLIAGYLEPNPTGDLRDLLEKQLATIPVKDLLWRDPHLAPDKFLMDRYGFVYNLWIDTFMSSEVGYSLSAFQDSSDGQDNAIFSKASVTMQDIADPTEFQHPVQAAYVARNGFDAVIVTVHLSWTNTALREQEKAALKGVVTGMLVRDPDLIINGDFNTTEQGIQELAEAIGMVVMVPTGQDGVGTTHANNRYDHFLVSPDLANEEAQSCAIQTFTGADLATAKRVSDHLPLLAFFATDEKYKDRD